MLNATASTITGNTTLGAAVFNYTIPPGSDAAYDTSAVVVIQVGAVKSQAHLFSPANPNWVQDNITVGNSMLSVNFTYTPPVASGQLGNLTLNSGTMSLSGQSPQPMTSSSLVNWDTSGNVY
jgi:hypothetical protein